MTPLRRRTLEWLFAALPLLAYVGVVSYSLSARGRLEWVFLNTSYYFITALVVVWCWSLKDLLDARGVRVVEWVRTNRAGLALALGFVTVCFVSVPPKLRVLCDEANLLSVSQSMLMSKTVKLVTQGKFYYRSFWPIDGAVPLRPLLFPYFEYLVHLIAGYSYKNAFALNFLTLWAVLALVYLVTVRWLDRVSGLAAMLLVLAYPVVVYSATSGGFDLFNLLMVALALTAFFILMREPGPASQAFLWMQLIALCNARSESCVLVFILFGAAVFWRYFSWKNVRARLPFYSIAPLLMLPYTLQVAFNYLYFDGAPNVKGALRFSVFKERLPVLIKGQFDFGFVNPFANLLNLGAVVLTIGLLVAWHRRKACWSRGKKLLLMAMLLPVTAAVVALSQFDAANKGYLHPTSARHYILLSVGAALVPVAFRIACPAVMTSARLLALASVAVALYFPIATTEAYHNTLILFREVDAVSRYLEANGKKNVLLITEMPVNYTAQGYGAVGFGFASVYRDQILGELKRHLFQDVLVVQQIAYSDFKPMAQTEIDPGYSLEAVYELQNTAESFIRISRVANDK